MNLLDYALNVGLIWDDRPVIKTTDLWNTQSVGITPELKKRC